MKRSVLLLTVAISMLAFASCQKLKDVLFESFETPFGFDVTVPIVTKTDAEITLGESNVRFNLDSVIRANTANVFGADVVGNMQIKEVAFEVVDGNASSNLSNFAYVKMEVSASGSAPVVMGPYNIPATATSSISFPAGNSFNIKNLFSGATVNFKIAGKARTATTQAMKVRVNTIIAFDK